VLVIMVSAERWRRQRREIHFFFAVVDLRRGIFHEIRASKERARAVALRWTPRAPFSRRCMNIKTFNMHTRI